MSIFRLSKISALKAFRNDVAGKYQILVTISRLSEILGELLQDIITRSLGGILSVTSCLVICVDIYIDVQ